MLWLGGMLFLATVGAPVLRAIEPPALRQRLFQEPGLRFRVIGSGAIALLIDRTRRIEQVVRDREPLQDINQARDVRMPLCLSVKRLREET